MQRNLITLLILVGIAVVAVVAWQKMNEPRTPGEKMDAALEQLGDGNVGQAVDEIRMDTPAEQVSDAINDGIDRMQETISPAGN
jgi:hypothetical protein